MDGFYLEMAKILIENEYAMERNKEVIEKIVEKYSEENERVDKK